MNAKVFKKGCLKKASFAKERPKLRTTEVSEATELTYAIGEGIQADADKMAIIDRAWVVIVVVEMGRFVSIEKTKKQSSQNAAIQYL